VAFTLSSLSPGATAIRVTLGASEYYGGDTATATWVIGGVNGSAPVGWTVASWWVWEYDSNNLYTTALLASGTINSTQTTGTFSFGVPINYGDEVIVQVNAYNSTASISGATHAVVFAPTIFLNPSEAFYLPGDVVTIGVSTQGQALSTAPLWETVVDSSGNTLQSGPVSNSQVQFTVSKVAAPSSIRVSVSAQSPQLGVIASATTTVDQGSGLYVTAGIATVSSYVDGSFQPGETISLQYTITALGSSVLPKVFTILIYPGTTFYGSLSGTEEFETSTSSGTLQYTIPSGTPAGDQVFALETDASPEPGSRSTSSRTPRR